MKKKFFDDENQAWQEPNRHEHPEHRHGRPPHRHSHPKHLQEHTNEYESNFSNEAEATLCRAVEPSGAEWILRVVSFGPREIRAILRVQLAIMASSLGVIDALAIEIKPSSLDEIQSGGETVKAISNILPSEEVDRCIYNLFQSPREVQGIALVGLINARLSTLIARADLLSIGRKTKEATS